MNIDRVSKETLVLTTNWIKCKPTGAKFDTLTKTFAPLLTELTSVCDWAVTGVKTGDSRFFIPKIKGEKNDSTTNSAEINFKIKVSNIISSLSNRGHILSTIDFCTQLYLQNKSLSIWASSHGQNLCPSHLHICVFSFLSHMKEYRETFTQKINDFNLNDVENNNKLKELKESLERDLITCPNVDFLGNKFTVIQHNSFSTLQFKLYLSLVTLIESKWDRIVMLPTMVPSGHLHHPGGLVMCETSDNNFIDFETLEDLRRISSIPFLPWMLTARTTERGSDQHLSPKLYDFKKGITNDYRNIEYLMGGKKYTLTNKSLFKLYNNKELNERKLKSLSNIANFIGVKRVCKFLSDKGLINTSNQINIDFSNLPIELNKKPKNDKSYDTWVKEMRQKRANIESSHISEFSNKISIIIPIASSNERVKNFLIALNSYNSQTAIIRSPELFEIIVLIDSDSEDSAYRINIINTILNHINNQNLENLKKVKLQVYYSQSSESIGRSSIRNFGINKSRGTVIQLFDDSIILHQNYLEEVLIRFEHLRGQKIAVVGFKERVDKDLSTCDTLLKLMNANVFLPDARDDFKRREKADKTIHYGFHKIEKGKDIDYMRLTGDLCFMNGNQCIGSRTLNQFFSTSNVSFWKDECIASGGFHYRFDKDWGMEDGHLGMLMTATGTKVIPCYSALALDLKHTKDKTKVDSKERGERPLNMDVEIDLNGKQMSYYNKNLFKKSVANVSEHFIGPFHLKNFPSEK